MDTYVTLALIIVFLLLCLIGFVYYKESGWKLVKKDEHRHGGHGPHGHREHEERERERERRERWRREQERERDRYR